ncbi:uncharacterized protein LOC132948948 [Metopolophium dirhodum]|uniref:uncharacterized protein LOC132948948 n=1 Tax=Metopolophium dirhodum TaxID=44670 RepID=UPI00298F8C17|nr:uncharacterized protein LOC132948948 [Metopolophium dirhodum]
MLQLPNWIMKDSSIIVKQNSNYYFQVIGQLHITKRELCYLVVYTEKWTTVEKIYYDHTFWIQNMSEKLMSFYLNCLLPELVDPLYGKRLLISDIRDPDDILEKQQERFKIVSLKKIKKS